MPLASKHLVSFQNRQWMYVLLMNVWTAAMKTIMLCYHQDGIVLGFCFLQHFASTPIENFHLSEMKLHPDL
jgi:hypothetical protein